MVSNVGFLLILLCLVTFAITQQSPKLEMIPDDAQADFAWTYFKQSFNQSNNMIQSPFALRLILAFLANFETSTKQLTQWRKDLRLYNLELTNRKYQQQLQKYKRKTAFRAASLTTFNTKDQPSKALEYLAMTFNISLYRNLIQREIEKPAAKGSINSRMRTLTRNNRMIFVTNFKDLPKTSEMAIYSSVTFAGVWNIQFEENFSKTCYFQPEGREKVLVEYMYLEEILPAGRFTQHNMDIVELPLRNGSACSCLLIKPTRGNLEQVINKLDHRLFIDVYKKLTKQKVEVELPAFTIVKQFRTGKVLQKMGLQSLFAPKRFQMTENKYITLGNIIQRVAIQVVKTGDMEARKEMTLDRSLPFTFSANRPFIIMIIDKVSLVPIMMGHYAYPDLAPSRVNASAYQEMMCHRL